MNLWAFKPLSIEYIGFCLGAHFAITTPRRYWKAHPYRSIVISVGICGLNVWVTIPLWVDNVT
jgi:predicted naringenin-chalcone synthase